MSEPSSPLSAYMNTARLHLRLPLFRNAYALIAAAFSSSALGMLYWVVAARLYTTEAVGINLAVISTMNFLAAVSRLSMESVLIRFLPRSGEHAGRLIGAAYFIGATLAGVAGILFLSGLRTWAPGLSILRTTAGLSVAFVVATVCAGIFTQQDGALAGLREARWVPVENTFFAMAKLALIVLLARPMPETGIFVSWAISLALTIVPVNWLLFRRLVPKHVETNRDLQSWISRGAVARYAGGLYFSELTGQATVRLLPLIVLHLAGAEAAAFFSLPWMIAQSLNLITDGMMSSLTVEASRTPERLAHFARKVLRGTFRLVIPAVAVVLLAAPWLLLVLGRAYATESTLLLRLLALTSLPYAVNGLYLAYARVRHLIRNISLINAVMSVAILGLSAVFLRRWGVASVGFALLASNVTLACVLLATALRPILWPRQRPETHAIETEEESRPA